MIEVGWESSYENERSRDGRATKPQGKRTPAEELQRHAALTYFENKPWVSSRK
jgi:hypothetical protein